MQRVDRQAGQFASWSRSSLPTGKHPIGTMSFRATRAPHEHRMASTSIRYGATDRPINVWNVRALTARGKSLGVDLPWQTLRLIRSRPTWPRSSTSSSDSLYAHTDVFLRELISNASDALDRLRFRALTDPELLAGDTALVIRISADAERRTLTIEDTGIGMTEEELVKSLGTIAHSGSRAFLERLAQQGQRDARLIGQFGVGFYSAFLVAERVDVVSRAAGSGQTGHVWISNGKDTFTVAPADRSERGTAVVLHVRDDQREFLEPWRLRQLVERYSDYVSHPIQLRVTKGTGDQATTDFETINRASALWQRPKSDITEEQYDEFYRHLAHGDGVKPVARAHFKIEGTREFTGLLYIPRERPLDPPFGMKHRGLRLYVKRVLVMDDCDDPSPSG